MPHLQHLPTRVAFKPTPYLQGLPLSLWMPTVQEVAYTRVDQEPLELVGEFKEPFQLHPVKCLLLLSEVPEGIANTIAAVVVEVVSQEFLTPRITI